MTPSAAPLHPPQLIHGFCIRRNILGVDWFLVQFVRELKEQLQQIARRAQPVRSRAVVPLFVSFQFPLQAEDLNVQIISTLALLFGALALLVRSLLLTVTLRQQLAQNRLQRCAVLR